MTNYSDNHGADPGGRVLMWWYIRLFAVIVLVNSFVDAAGYDTEMWSLDWWFKSVLVAVVAVAIIGTEEDGWTRN